MTLTQTLAVSDAAAIRALIDAQFANVCAKDLDRIVEPYTDDSVVFDVKPPWQTKGRDAWRETWAACLPYFPSNLRPELRDMNVMVNGDLAVAHWLWRFISDESDNPAAQTWMRMTAAYRKLDGNWRVLHEHCSVPFDPMTGKAVFSLNV